MKIELEKVQQFNREKIIRAAHPECKTLKEALEKELLLYCLLKIHTPVGKQLCLLLDWDTNDLDELEYYVFQANTIIAEYKNYKKEDIIEIIGLPLTLSRVLNAIEKKLELRNDFLFENKPNEKFRSYILYNNGRLEQYYFERHISEVICDWKLLNEDGTDCTLEQQSEETQLQIAKLLGYEEEV